LLQDNEDSQEELRLYDIDLREVVDENSQMTKELRRTQSKIEQLEFARLQVLESREFKWLNLGLRATQLFGHLGISEAWIQVSCAMLRGSGR
ncbi:hypothetical protein LEN26_002303, partial [Aphanomyces euteiches]